MRGLAYTLIIIAVGILCTVLLFSKAELPVRPVDDFPNHSEIK